mmetsp:Transcript_116434/g.323625  ORF Transcript_116434/g.323625 Transcript_116434/m.323625 type:complete len:208 (-) Transcript_116434:898-1521(-)
MASARRPASCCCLPHSQSQPPGDERVLAWRGAAVSCERSQQEPTQFTQYERGGRSEGARRINKRRFACLACLACHRQRGRLRGGPVARDAGAQGQGQGRQGGRQPAGLAHPGDGDERRAQAGPGGLHAHRRAHVAQPRHQRRRLCAGLRRHLLWPAGHHRAGAAAGGAGGRHGEAQQRVGRALQGAAARAARAPDARGPRRLCGGPG